jgi:hypothetical protein
MVIHGTLLSAVQAHAGPVVSAIGVPGPPDGPIVWRDGEIAYEHDAAS